MEKKQNENSKRIIKNLSFNPDNGQFFLIDNQNNSFLCDMFGRQKYLFKSKLTGMYNRYNTRNKLKPLLIRNFKENKELLSPIKLTEQPIYSKNKNFNTISVQKSINYHPFRKRFEDKYGLPKPLAPPFFNEKNGDLKEKNKKELIEHLNKYFSNEVCKNDISMNNEPKKIGLSYLTGDLNEYKAYNEDNKIILKIIDDTIETYREQYKNKLDILYKNPIVKAIINFKKFLLLNRDIKTINGYKLNEPCEEIKEKNTLVNDNIKMHFDKIKEINIKHDKLIESYKLLKYKDIEEKYNNEENDENEIYNETLTQGNQIIVGPDKLNNLCKSKDFTIGRLLEMDFGFTEEDHKNKLNRIKRLGNSAFRNKNNNKINKSKRMKLFSGLRSNKSNLLNNSKKAEEEHLNSSKVEITYKETVETLSNKNHNLSDLYNYNSNNNNNNKTLEQKIKDNELSFISEVSERESNVKKKRIFRIKSVKSQRVKTELENKLLEGFQQTEDFKLKEDNNNDINKKEFKLKSNLDNYKNDLNIFKKVNPQAYERQKKEEEHDYLLLKKRLELLALLEKTKRKNKNKINEKVNK